MLTACERQLRFIKHLIKKGNEMPNLSDLEINLDGMEDSLKIIEKSLNEIIHNVELTPSEIRTKASICMQAVNRYTKITNKNVRLLNEQAYYLLDKVRKIQEKTESGIEGDETAYEIH